MERRAQASIEYIFTVILALVVIYLALKRFLDPRTGTVRREGKFVNETIDKITTSLNSMISGQ